MKRHWKKQRVGDEDVADVSADSVKAALRGFYENVKVTMLWLPSGQMLRTPFAFFWWEE